MENDQVSMYVLHRLKLGSKHPAVIYRACSRANSFMTLVPKVRFSDRAVTGSQLTVLVVCYSDIDESTQGMLDTT